MLLTLFLLCKSANQPDSFFFIIIFHFFLIQISQPPRQTNPLFQKKHQDSGWHGTIDHYNTFSWVPSLKILKQGQINKQTCESASQNLML